MGTADDRPDTWGTAASQMKPITFHAPAGYRVRVLRVYGDFVVWPRGSVRQVRHTQYVRRYADYVPVDSKGSLGGAILPDGLLLLVLARSTVPLRYPIVEKIIETA